MSDQKLKKKGEHPAVRDIPTLEALHPVTGSVIQVDFEKDVGIGVDLEVELRELPSRIAWYMSIRDVAADVLRQIKHEEYCVEEDLYLELKEELSMGGKVTETEVKNRIKAHSNMRSAYRARMQAESRCKHAESVVAMMLEKRWALQSLVKLKTAEMSTGLGDA